MCRKRLSSPRCRSELIDSVWVVIVPEQKMHKKKKKKKLEIFLYADDLKIYNEIKSSDDVEALQNGVDKLYDCTQYSLVR